MKPIGTKNILSLGERKSIPTVASMDLSTGHDDKNAKKALSQLVKVNDNFIRWIKKHHGMLSKVVEGGKPPSKLKKKIFDKYCWYAEKLVILEAINGFETFYKNSLISLATVLRDYVDIENITGNVDIKILWIHKHHSPPKLLLENQIFYDLAAIDKYTRMFLNKARYDGSNKKLKREIQEICRGIRCMFQIRHTLSHNNGKVIKADRTKFKSLGYDVAVDQFINPLAESLAESIKKLIETESEFFSNFLKVEALNILKKKSSSEEIPMEIKDILMSEFGTIENEMKDIKFSS
jgi:hypothetical protein